MILVAGGCGLIGRAVVRHLFPGALNYDPAEPRTLDNLDKEFDTFIDCARYRKPSDQFKVWNTVINTFRQNQGGRMILFSSIYGHKAPRFEMYPGTEIAQTPLEYAMWKAATEQATRYLAERLKPWDIQVNCICPGGVLDNHSDEFQRAYIAAGGVRMIKTENLLPVIDMLLHKDNAVNGQVITCDRGWTL